MEQLASMSSIAFNIIPEITSKEQQGLLLQLISRKSEITCSSKSMLCPAFLFTTRKSYRFWKVTLIKLSLLRVQLWAGNCDTIFWMHAEKSFDNAYCLKLSQGINQLFNKNSLWCLNSMQYYFISFVIIWLLNCICPVL